MENTDDHCKDSIIKEYFLAGFSYTEILAFLSMYYGTELSLRQLHRNLRRLGMFRRKNRDDINTIIIIIKREADTSNSGYGYRMMHQGPNYAWHIDGYDKLKPYGFALHGCIDGYSRKIL